MINHNSFNKNTRLVVLGGGESGVGAAILAKDLGMDVFLSDFGTIPQKYADILTAENIPFEQGGHTPGLILNATEIVKSPGIPPTAPIMKAVAEKNIPVISEIEFAGRFTDAKMVCITGSNGKTTTTLLTYHVLRQAGVDAGLAGNVGRSLALQVAREPHKVYVIELSSFQLENMYQFKANIAVILNITPDHLDRYDYKMQNYVNAKFRIIQNQTPADAFIYWKDDPIIAEQLRHVSTVAHMLPFTDSDSFQPMPGFEGAYLDMRRQIVFKTPETEMTVPAADLSLKGRHNLYNSMAAGLSACLLDIRRDDIRRALEDFEGVEHRLEFTAVKNGVTYINDSKATNVNSCWYALESMPDSKNTVLILGGKDKGNDYSEIDDLVRRKVNAIVCMGKDNSKLMQFFSGKVPQIFDTHSLQQAVDTCAAVARPGDTVLLSPCCASFDLFNSYEDRGCRFKDAVRKLSD